MNDTFCTDLISLFWNHVWACDDCFDKIFIGSFLYFLLLFLCFILYNMFVDWFEKKLDRLKYVKENQRLSSELQDCKDMIDDLRSVNQELIEENIKLKN